MKVLILNWRSINDPLAGGAEKVTLEHAKRWIKNYQAEVIWLSPRYEDGPNEEVVEGVKFVYVAGPLTRNLLSLVFAYPFFLISTIFKYQSTYKNKIDVVIDEVHGLPFMTPLYVKEKIVVFIHEVAGEIWDKMYPFPINKIGRFLERLFFKSYRRTPFITGAFGIKNDLVNIGIPQNNINVVNHGLEVNYDFRSIPKENNFTLLFVNRVVAMKGPDRSIEVLEKLKNTIPDAKLWIVGKGEESYVNQLKDLAKNKHLENNITFFGFVSEEEKFKLMAKANVFINTSIKEGWGLGNLESNTQGTPAVAFNVTGNQESIGDKQSGYLCSDINDMVIKIISLKNNPLNQKNIEEYPKQFNWEVQSEKFYKILEQNNI